MKSIIIFITVCAFVVPSGLQAFGEEWTAEQKEVWKTVDAQWELILKGGFEALVENYHKDVLIWWPHNSNPSRKESMEGQFRDWFGKGYTKPVSYELNPAAINIFGNISTVYFYYKWESENPSIIYKGRNFQVFIKQDGKWKMLGSSTCPCGENTFCY